MTRKHPVKVSYRGFEFTVSDFGDRMARFGASEGFRNPTDERFRYSSIQRADGWLSRSPESCIKKIIRSIDDEIEKVKDPSWIRKERDEAKKRSM